MSNQVTIEELPQETLSLDSFFEASNDIVGSFKTSVQDFSFFYQLLSEKNATNGYAGLSSGLLNIDQLADSGTQAANRILALNTAFDATEWIDPPVDGILTINNDATAAQVIDNGTGIAVSSPVAGTTRITLDANFTELNDVTVTSIDGNIVFFNSSWISLAIGNQDDVLTVSSSGFPEWAPATAFSTLDSLTDTNIVSRAPNEVLVVDSGNLFWVNAKLVNDNLAQGVFGNITGLGNQTVELDMGENNIIEIAVLNLKKNNTTAFIELDADHDVPATTNVIGKITFFDNDDVASQRNYAFIEAIIEDPDSSNLSGKLSIGVTTVNTENDSYILLNNANAGTVKLLKDLDLTNLSITNAVIDADDGVSFANIDEDSLTVTTGTSGFVLTSNGSGSAPSYQVTGSGDVSSIGSVAINTIAIFTNTAGKTINQGGEGVEHPSISAFGDIVIPRSILFENFQTALSADDEYIVNNNNTLTFNASVAHEFTISNVTLVTAANTKIWTYADTSELVGLNRIVMNSFNASAIDDDDDFLRLENLHRLTWDHNIGNDVTYFFGDDNGFMFVNMVATVENTILIVDSTNLTLFSDGLNILNIKTLDFVDGGESTISGITGAAGILVDLDLVTQVFRIDILDTPEYQFEDDRLDMKGNFLTDLPDIRDANAAKILEFITVASAVDYLQLSNDDGLFGVLLECVGTSTNIDLVLKPKGDGVVDFSNEAIQNVAQINDSTGAILIDFSPVGTANSFFDIANGVGAAGPTISAAGSVTNIDLNIEAKGSGEINLDSLVTFGADVIDVTGNNFTATSSVVFLIDNTVVNVQTINGGSPGTLLIAFLNAAGSITFDQNDNIRLDSVTTRTIDTLDDNIVFVQNSVGNWVELVASSF